jgi:SAM-dependent methyltransferase
MPEASVHVRSGKAQFGHVYNQADPRGYFQTLHDLDYQIPAHGKRVVGRLVQRRRERLDREDVVVLDLCCSYGINAALLNHDLTLDALYSRYGSPELAALSSDELAVADRAFYGKHRRSDPVRVVGIDVADQAVAHAQCVGLRWAGSRENLEIEDPSTALADLLTGVDLITVAGGIGYITERTFDRVLKHASAEDGCWVAAFALRWVPYEGIAEVLARYGLATEQLSGHTFRQRRFADDTERDYVLGKLENMGIDPAGKEAEGWYHSNFYLSCPAEHNRPSLRELLSGCVD